MEKKVLEYDCLILGGGPAGFAAGIYAARGAIKTAIVDISMMGGMPSNYLELENYPGFSIIGGFELMEKFEEHADKFGVDKYPMQEIAQIDLVSPEKSIETHDTIFKSKTIILSTGAKSKKLSVPGEQEFIGRGVSYCAVCDGAFFRDKVVSVVGGGNSALEEAMYLTRFAKKVYIVHRRDELRADRIVQERAFANEKIEFVFDSIPVEIKGKDSVNGFVVKNTKTGKTKELKTDGVFPYIGFSPNVELFNGQIHQDAGGFVIVNPNLETSVSGVFAAGDVRVTPLRQVITAAADGAISANSAIRHLEEVHSRVLA